MRHPAPYHIRLEPMWRGSAGRGWQRRYIVRDLFSCVLNTTFAKCAHGQMWRQQWGCGFKFDFVQMTFENQEASSAMGVKRVMEKAPFSWIWQKWTSVNFQALAKLAEEDSSLNASLLKQSYCSGCCRCWWGGGPMTHYNVSTDARLVVGMSPLYISSRS